MNQNRIRHKSPKTEEITEYQAQKDVEELIKIPVKGTINRKKKLSIFEKVTKKLEVWGTNMLVSEVKPALILEEAILLSVMELPNQNQQ